MTKEELLTTEQTTLPVLTPPAKVNFEKKLDWDEFRPLFHQSWHTVMKKAVESEWMYDIYQKIKESARTERILPDSDNTFRSFEYCNLKDVKVVMILLDPYPRLYKDGTPQATGIPMDCSNSPDGKLQPSLDVFYDALDKSLGKKVERSKSLQYLLQQGVLLLNSELTVKKNKTGSMEGLWAPFHKFLYEQALYSYTGTVYILAGAASQKLEKYINPLGNYIFPVEHPAAAAHKSTDWDYKDIFNRTNKLLESNNGPLAKIHWDKADWDSKSLPF